jgi:hypothetical protein
MSDKKISQLTAATTPLAGTEVLPIVQSGATVKVTVDNLTTGKAVTVGSLTDAGNLSFTGTGSRITGDFSSATIANRVAFQSSATNGATVPVALPNGTSTTAGFVANSSSSDPANASEMIIAVVGGSDVRFASQIRGTGTYLPMSFFNGGSKRLEITTAGDVSVTTGNLVIGTSGKGIDFSADPSAAGMTSELLDDYEEGTWTPTDASGAGLTFNVQTANYTKIGRIVTVYLQFVYPSTLNGSNAVIGGLPFNAASGIFSPAIINTGANLPILLRTVSGTSTAAVLNSSTSVAITNAQLSLQFIICTLSYSV